MAAQSITRHHTKDFEGASHALHASLRSRLYNIDLPDHRYPEGVGSALFPGGPDAYAHPNLEHIFPQSMDMDMSQFSADQATDPDVMSMWSTAPAGFQ